MVTRRTKRRACNGGFGLGKLLEMGFVANKYDKCRKEGKVWATGSRCGFFRSSSGCCIKPLSGGTRKRKGNRKGSRKGTRKGTRKGRRT